MLAQRMLYLHCTNARKKCAKNNEKFIIVPCRSKYITEPSWVICEGLRCGRRSFRGMNPTIERLMELENCDNKSIVKKIKEEDVDVTVEEMAEFQRQESTLVETIAKKFKRAKPDPNEAPIKKLKFMKPEED